MENLLHAKYAQINDLQSYLLSELQDIENCKSRNRRISNILTSIVMPTIQQIRATVQSLKSFFDPFQLMAINYVEAVSEKCKNLIKEKDQQIQEYQTEVEKLRAEVDKLKKIKGYQVAEFIDTEPKFAGTQWENKQAQTRLDYLKQISQEITNR